MNKHIEELTPEIIQAYREGLLNTEQMHAVEKLMLESSLYGEGFEGLDRLGRVDFEQDIEELSNRIDDVIDDGKSSIWNVYTKLAATILLLAISTAVFFSVQNNNITNKNLTARKVEESQTDSISQEDNLVELKDSILAQPDESQDKIKDTKTIAKAEKPSDENTIDLAESNDILENLSGKVAGTQTVESKPSKKLAFSLPSVKSDSLLNDSSESFEASSGIKPKAQDKRSSFVESSPRKAFKPNLRPEFKTLIGRVIDDEDGKPLARAMIIELGKNRNVTTDNEGKFVFDSLKENSTLLVRYVGYLNQEIKIENQNRMEIRIKPDPTPLDEVIQTKLASDSESNKIGFTNTEIDSLIEEYSDFPKIKVREAIPENGHRDYDKYLKDSLKYPRTAREQRIRGKVVLEFIVMEDGQLSGFKILKKPWLWL